MMLHSRIPLLLAGILAFVGSLSQDADAAVVTTQEASLNSIFSQGSFAADPIGFRFNASITIIDPDLTTIDSSAEFSTLGSLASGPSSTIQLFYVDAINWCGSPGTNIVGCGANPGNLIVLNSLAAAHPLYGPELIAHEMGHNLGLGHTGGAGLMGPMLNLDTSLSAAEVTTIRSSPLVQLDALGYYINVTPVLVQATAVPEPGSLALLTLFGVVFCVVRRRRVRR
ncbi:hypothetical protein Q31b_54640 [Novipirellula aureliae]|uniref:Ice-binding protein C-terminal domain-containing protein n=1 Tax=Novipirellula aureliae TaxID=2527966 RepID=A0A5C6DF96_9BACT|nr:zinc-dependent metalloprotease family protein [Novipirellula aureliae]TWU35368.1 hypothetical protein Q31b_54640 [Novipirellula aureliae]